MSNLVTDTHSAIWYFSDSTKLSPDAILAFDSTVANGEAIVLPTIAIVEIIYLINKNRLHSQTLSKLVRQLNDQASSFITQDLTPEIAYALARIPRASVPDMPDRIISATALQLKLPLVTKDRNIRSLPFIQTIW